MPTACFVTHGSFTTSDCLLCDAVVYVDLPNAAARQEILRTHGRRMTFAPDVDLALVAGNDQCTGFSGADLAALVREAATAALRRLFAAGPVAVASREAGVGTGARDDAAICNADFAVAFSKVTPSVNEKDLARYRGMHAKLRGSRAHIAAPDDAAIAASEPTDKKTKT